MEVWGGGGEERVGASLSRSRWGPGEAEGRSTGDGEWGLGSCGRAGRRAFCLPSMYSWGRTYNVAQIILVSVQTDASLAQTDYLHLVFLLAFVVGSDLPCLWISRSQSVFVFSVYCVSP